MKTYNFSEFMRNEHESKVKPPKASLLPLAVAPFMPVAAHAETAQENVQIKVMNAFDPLIDLIVAFAYPAALAVMMGGAMYLIFGNSDKGFSMIQKAGMGYVALMLLPMIFDILVKSMEGIN